MNAIDTDDLIRRLAREPRPPAGTSLEARLRFAALGGGAFAVLAVLVLVGVRADLGSLLLTAPIVLKFVGGLAVAVAAYRVAVRLARPGSSPLCSLSVALLGAMVALCIAALIPAAAGRSELPSFAVFETCSVSIALLGILPLAFALSALRVGAATCPGLAGAAAGVLAGAIAAFAYALACPLDNPQFAVVAYMAGVAVLAIAGGIAGRAVLAW